jgi:hypothetical protein
MNTTMTPANATKTTRLNEMLVELLQQTLRRGFHGTARLEFVVQDGTIQHLRRSLEQMEK